MNKIWFIDDKGKIEGPYSVADLKADSRITPDSYVWREGWDKWQRIRDVPELEELFRDEVDSDEPVETAVAKPAAAADDELAIDYRQEPPYLFWLLAAMIIILYMIIQLYWNI